MLKDKAQRKEAARQRRLRRLQKIIPAEFSKLMRGLPLPPPLRWRDVAEAFRTKNIDIIMGIIKRRAKTPQIKLPKYHRGNRNWLLSRKELDAANFAREREFKIQLAASLAAVPDKMLAGQEALKDKEEVPRSELSETRLHSSLRDKVPGSEND